jgi:hypothetical protein
VRKAHFKRGFVEGVECTATAFIQRGRDWAAATPLGGIRLSGVAGKADRLAACPHLARIKALHITDCQFGDDDLAALAQSPYLAGLRVLRLRGTSSRFYALTKVGDRGTVALATSPFFASLVCLTIYSWWSLGWDGVEALAGAAEHAALEELHLNYTAIEDRGAVALAHAAGLGALKSLSISGGRLIHSAGVIALLNSPHLRGLEHAWFCLNRVTGDIMEALAEGSLTSALRYLDLRSNELGVVDIDAVSRVLERHPGLSLGLKGCEIPRAVQAELARRFPDVVSLDYVPKARKRTRVS